MKADGGGGDLQASSVKHLCRIKNETCRYGDCIVGKFINIVDTVYVSKTKRRLGGGGHTRAPQIQWSQCASALIYLMIGTMGNVKHKLSTNDIISRICPKFIELKHTYSHSVYYQYYQTIQTVDA